MVRRFLAFAVLANQLKIVIPREARNLGFWNLPGLLRIGLFRPQSPAPK